MRKGKLWPVLLLTFMAVTSTHMSGVRLKEARYYRRLDDDRVWCQLCPRKCIIPEGRRGFCRVRENRGGKLYTLVYGKPCVVNIGPIEKAPLYHMIPGHRRLTLATVSCNLRCKHCHNWHISQIGPEKSRYYNMSPEQVVAEAIRLGVTSISFTYTEPTVFYEYMYDIAKLARAKGLKTSIVSNGYINPEPLKELLKVLDAVKIDLKGFTQRFYQEVCSAELEPVLNTLKVLKEEGAFFEIVNLIIPTLNDDPEEIRQMCLWIKENLGPDVPLHFTRFSPAYKMTHLPATPVSTLEMAVKIAHQVGLRYVYIGNVPGHKYNSTFCPQCGRRLIHRIHFSVLSNDVKEGRCPYCGCEIPGIWK